MRKFTITHVPAAAALVALLVAGVSLGASTFPAPLKDVAPAAGAKTERAVLAGGCFWGVEAVFERLRGVTSVVSGYSGGARITANYDRVSIGDTGHAEAVEITYEPSQVTFGQLLRVYFAVAHDPTELNRQGPDVGTQYRSTIFYVNEDQKQVAVEYIQQLDAAKVFPRRIATTVVPLEAFYSAERYHQNFLDNNRDNPYIVEFDLPKLVHLQKEFPELTKSKAR